jgi:hypothetical protein
MLMSVPKVRTHVALLKDALTKAAVSFALMIHMVFVVQHVTFATPARSVHPKQISFGIMTASVVKDLRTVA